MVVVVVGQLHLSQPAAFDATPFSKESLPAKTRPGADKEDGIIRNVAEMGC